VGVNHNEDLCSGMKLEKNNHPMVTGIQIVTTLKILKFKAFQKLKV